VSGKRASNFKLLIFNVKLNLSIPFTRSISCCATALVHELHAPIEALRDAIVFGNLPVNQNFSGQALLEYAALHLNPTQLTRT
jgi:hypothetical protein